MSSMANQKPLIQKRRTKVELPTFLNRSGETATVRLRLCNTGTLKDPSAGNLPLRSNRLAEADAFYQRVCPFPSPTTCACPEAAFAGLLWNKQLYHYNVETWLKGDPESLSLRKREKRAQREVVEPRCLRYLFHAR